MFLHRFARALCNFLHTNVYVWHANIMYHNQNTATEKKAHKPTTKLLFSKWLVRLSPKTFIRTHIIISVLFFRAIFNKFYLFITIYKRVY